jgi:hypothetical protein
MPSPNKPRKLSNVNPSSTDTGEMCPSHNRPLEVICVDHKKRICTNCALFGDHKNHDIRMEEELLTEIASRTELLIEMF